jgi:hydroxyethylthiazole kinase
MPASDFFDTIEQVRRDAPLVHCMTNLVVANFTANVLLALGAAPAMVVAREEAGEFAALAGALLVNLGTLDAPQAEAMELAVAAARRAGRPWVLDPVAVGALGFRTRFAQRLLDAGPAAIRGNASEIISLAGGAGGARGVDSTANIDAARAAAHALAARTGAVVGVTGQVDYLTDARRECTLANGSALMTRVTGVGCALSASVAACVAASGDAWLGTAAALAYTGVCGELAARDAPLPGSFAVAYLDRLAATGRDAFDAALRCAAG